MTASTSTSVTALWEQLPTDSRNGVIKGFKLFINRKGSEDKLNIHLVNASNSPVYRKKVTGLQESTEYKLQVLAFTSVGDGPKSPVQVVKTLEFFERSTQGEDLELIFLRFCLHVFRFLTIVYR